jgi:hypothetical protein
MHVIQDLAGIGMQTKNNHNKRTTRASFFVDVAGDAGVQYEGLAEMPARLTFAPQRGAKV